MLLVHTDNIVPVKAGETPDYDHDNPLRKLIGLIERTEPAAGRRHYVTDTTQHLFPFEHLDLHGPSAPQTLVTDPRQQDVKTDFQKQNVRDFRTADAELARGWASVGDQLVPWLRLSYRAGPDSVLSAATGHQLGDAIQAWVRVGRGQGRMIRIPYDERAGRYQVELWGHSGVGLAAALDPRGAASFAAGRLLAAPDLVRGTAADFDRPDIDERFMVEVSPDHAMHPVLPLHVEVAWSDTSGKFWDSMGGANHQYEFNMVLRGWNHFLGIGNSVNPHGGVGSLEYRNLASNYGRYAALRELGRNPEGWSFDAFGRKDHGSRFEPFLAVDYLDLHVLRGGSGIGLHRHRDNQEIFFMVEGRGMMVVGDWCLLDTRERCFEVRTLTSGHYAMLKGGQLHALANPTDEALSLFMFGGYD